MGILNGVEMTLSYIIHSVYRFCQFVLAVTVCGLYAVDLNAARKQHKYTDGKWVYAEVVGALAAVTSLLYIVPFTSRIPFAFAWDAILFILWIALFGVFGNLYIKENAEGNGGIERMKRAVWIDLVNALLWLFSTVGMIMYFLKHRHNRSTWTGRAKV